MRATGLVQDRSLNAGVAVRAIDRVRDSLQRIVGRVYGDGERVGALANRQGSGANRSGGAA